MKKLSILFIAAVAMIVTSCSIEKRTYRPGYHVEWHQRPDKVERADALTQAPSENSVPEATVLNEQAAASDIAPNTDAQQALVIPAKSELQAIETPKSKKASRPSRAAVREVREELKAQSPVAQGEVQINALDSKADGGLAVNEIVLVLLCIFLPWLATYLYEGSWGINSWIALLLWLLFILPGIIFAFLVCFAGVSL